MKRLLSAFLAIMMVATLLPVVPVFAEEGEPESTGIRIKYDLQGVVKKLGLAWEGSSTEASAAKRVPMTVMDFEASDGFFKFNNSSLGLFTGHSELNYNATIGFQISSGDWIAFDIFVPKAGTYTMEMWCGNYWKDTKTEIYVDGTLVGSYGNYEEGTVEKNATTGQVNQFTKVVDEPRYVEGIVFEKAGLHTIKFATNGTYATAGTFYLIDATEEKASCLATVVADADRTVLSYGTEQIAKIDTKLFMSDGSEADVSAYPISFRSDNTAVANVSADGVVTPIGAGVANITAYTTNEFGEEVFATKEITVVDDVTIKYDVVKHLYTDLGYSSSTAVADGSLNKLDETVTDGFYSYAGGSAYDANGIKYYARIQLMGVGRAMGFKINVPVAGIYAIEIDTLKKTPGRCDVDMDVYIAKDARSSYPKDKVGSYNCYDATANDGTAVRKYICEYNFDEPGEYFINFVIGTHHQPSTGNPYSYVGSFYLVGGTKSALMNGEITSTASSINKDNGETATVSATGFNSSTTEAETFIYTSSNPAIAEVDAETGVVTPKSEGKVTITATANGAEVANTLSTDITVTVNKPGEAVAETVSIYITGTAGGTVTASGVAAGNIDTATVGELITAEATAAEGYKFAYWKDSAGNVVSDSATYTFNAYTNTSIIAVFDNISETNTTIGVEFFDGNRDFLGFVEVAKGETFGSIGENAPIPNLTGYGFTGWSIAENTVINAVLRAVALYEEVGTAVSGVKVNGAEETGTKYDQEIKKTVDSAKAWYRDDKLVGYGDTYTYYVWGSTAITSSTEDVEDKLPLAVLNTNGDAYMLEYDAAGYEIVDAGILFGDDTHNTVNACYYKAKVKNIKTHGQFTAKKSVDTGSESKQTVVRGYVMFRDGNDIRVIYAD